MSRELVKDAEKTLGDSGRVLLRYSGTNPKPVSSSKAVTKSRSKLLPTVLPERFAKRSRLVVSPVPSLS